MAKTKSVDEIQMQAMSLTITELKEMVKHQFRQVVKFGPKTQGKIFFIEGEPGIGKTQIQAQICKELSKELESLTENDVFNKADLTHFKNVQKNKMHLEVQNLSARDSGDFSGLPYNVEIKSQLSEKEVQKMMLKFSQPDFLPTQGYGLIFWDEANRVFDLNMQAVLLSMWMDRGVNGHYLGDGYVQVMAGNPFKDPRFKTCELDEAGKGRVVIVRLNPTVEEATAFLEEKYKDIGGHFLVDYLKEDQSFCNLKSADGGFSPRDIDKCMEYTYSLNTLDAINKDPKTATAKLKLVENALTLYFSPGSAKKIMKFLQDERDITLKRIIEKPSLVKKVKKDDMPLNTFLAKELEKYIFVDNIYKVGIDKAERETITTVVEALHAESKGLLVTALFNAEKNHEKTPELIKWLNEEMFTRKALSGVKEAWNQVTTSSRVK